MHQKDVNAADYTKQNPSKRSYLRTKFLVINPWP
jgi:hypothetical protein